MDIKTKRFTTYGKKRHRVVDVSAQTKPTLNSERANSKTFSAHALLLAATLSPRKEQARPLPKALAVKPRAPFTPLTGNVNAAPKSTSTSPFESDASKPLKPVKRKAQPKSRKIAIASSDSEEEDVLPAVVSRVKRPTRTVKASAISISSTEIDTATTTDPFVDLPGPAPVPRVTLPEPEAVLKLERLQLEESSRPELSKHAVKANLRPLLRACGQDKPFDFSSFTERSHAAGMLCPFRTTDSKWCKLGEATYSEVFIVGGATEQRAVIKIIPLFHPAARKKAADRDEPITPEVTALDDALRELEITKLLQNGTGDTGFIALFGAHVVQGRYPAALLKEWDLYLKKNPSKAFNPRPSTFAVTQTYLLLCLPNGGVDLESFKLRSWTQAASILWQVATSLERAELSWNFEHRDLHWGNILIETFPIEQDLSIAQKLETHATPLRRSAGDDWPGRLEPARTGVKACIIDYTLSSANSATGDRRWFGGCDEEELFEGSGDIQFDVYRMMRTATKGDWEGFHPVTNLMWLHYLAKKLLHDKGLRSVAPQQTPRRATPTMNAFANGRRQKSKAKTLETKHERQERHSYEALRMAADGLGEVLDRWMAGTAVAGEKDVWLNWTCSADFTCWWAYSSLFRQ